MRTGFTTAFLACALVTGGCNAEPAQEPALEGAEPQGSAAPASDTSGAPTAVADAMTAEGWESIRMGMTLDEVNAAIGTSMTLEGNLEYEEANCTFLNLPAQSGQPSVMYADGMVIRLSLFAPGTVTYGGIQVGDPAAKVREVFGADVVALPHKYEDAPAEYLTVWMKAPANADDQSARGVRFETGADGAITAIHAGGPAIELVEGCF